MDDALMQQLQQPRKVRSAIGKRARKDVPRSSHGLWQPAVDRADPLELLQAQDSGRIEHLLPIKYGRMVASPFAFLRGSAVVMAADLEPTPVIGQDVILCGDAHISNFGLFASPERKLVFDINDFDECYRGPWEWDLKRLAASIIVAGRQNKFSDKKNMELAAEAVLVYRRGMRRFSKMPALDLWYFHVDAKEVARLFDEEASKQSRKEINKIINKAHARTQEQTMEKLTHLDNGRRRINFEPPLLVPFRELDLGSALERLAIDLDLKETTMKAVSTSWGQYLDSVSEDRKMFLERFRVTDVALRVGGVGSVGTRCFILLLEGSSPGEGMILQLKESGESALEAYLPQQDYEQQARRVVIGQRLMQATSDPFLGWNRAPITGHDYYWRQLKDMKGSVDVADLDESGFQSYIAICALCLARAHARTGDPVVISGYMGKNDVFDKVIAEFAAAYANQTEKDHAALRQAIGDGRIEALEGI